MAKRIQDLPENLTPSDNTVFASETNNVPSEVTKKVTLKTIADFIHSEEGDVTGPTSAVSNNIATFDGATGKIIKDSGHALSEYVTLDQTTPQTVGDTDHRLTKVWATDLTMTNAISGSVTGNAGTVTGLTFVTGKTLKVDNIIEIAGTDSTKMTFPSTSATIARTDAAQTFTGTQTVAGLISNANNISINGVIVGMGASNPPSSGLNNTATGVSALSSNTTGSSNTANGQGALSSNTTGSGNTANGLTALYSNTTGSSNTATGADALYSNTTGYNNTANGVTALYSNTTGQGNTANGQGALSSNTTGSSNTANGQGALNSNTTGGGNTANGLTALNSNTTGSSNTAIGADALYHIVAANQNTANGGGAGPATDISSTTAIGFQAVPPNTNTIVVCSGSGTNTATAYVNTSTGLWASGSSDERVKNIKSSASIGLKEILMLTPKIFSFKNDSKQKEFHGFVAQDVQKALPMAIHPALTGGDHITYDMGPIIISLVNAVKELNAKIEKLEGAK